jgi:hypothetical protein
MTCSVSTKTRTYELEGIDEVYEVHYCCFWLVAQPQQSKLHIIVFLGTGAAGCVETDI